MQCYPSGSRENSACRKAEVADCAGNLLVPASNLKALLESFTLEGRERYALSDIQGPLDVGSPADFLLVNAKGKNLDKGLFGRRDVLEAFIGGRSVFKKKAEKFKNRSRDAETLEETVCHSVHTSIYDIRNKVLVISTQESGRDHTLLL